jgi:tetratricopeptide (TPR) repeat protein
MSDPLRTTPAAEAPASDADREALIERLLVAGLDHYFDGRYEQAVNVWTRVAFLERGHGRARAYIERARGALAERQRQSEELLHAGIAAYEAGEVARAREFLTRAVAEGGVNETALVFLQRLSRLEPGHASANSEWLPGHGGDAARVDPGVIRRTHRLSAEPAPRVNWFVTILASAAVAAAILLLAQPVASWLGELPVSAPAVSAQPAEPLPIVRGSELRLARARELYENGRLRDALRLLDGVSAGDPSRAAADLLRADVQRELLAAAGTGEGANTREAR